MAAVPFSPEEAVEATDTVLGLIGVVAAKLDPAVLSPGVVMERYQVVGQARKILAGVEGDLAAAVAASQQWKGKGDKTPTDRLAKEGGTTKKQAEDQIKTAKARKRSEPLDDAMRKGAVSPEQARAIADAVGLGDEAVQALLAMAAKGASLGELRDEAERRRLAKDKDPDAARKRAHRARSCRHWRRNGEFHLKLQTTVEVGAGILARLDTEADRLFAQRRSPDVATRDTFDQIRADAAANLLTRNPTEPDSDSEAEPAKKRSGPPRKGDPSGHLIGLLDLGPVLLPSDDEPVADLAGIGPVSLAALRTVLPDPWIQLILRRGKDANVTNIGQRGADLWQQAVLSFEHPRCTNERCHHRARLQNDHRLPYAVRQETALANLDPVCPWCHFLKTHRGYRLAPGTGRRPLLSPTEQAQQPQAATTEHARGP